MEQSESITIYGTTTQEGLRESVILPYPCVLLPHSPFLSTILSLPGSSTFPLLEISPKQINILEALHQKQALHPSQVTLPTPSTLY